MTIARPRSAAFWPVAITLMLLSVMSYLDRQILALLVPDLHRDLGMSDLQVGTLIGPAFLVTYLIALTLAATIVDRFDKVKIIVAGTLLWAAMTFASAFAKSYPELIAMRAGLAVGEALLGPAATALIGDLFFDDPRKRVTATSFFLMGSTIGATGSAFFGAAAIQLVSGWQVTLPRVGAAGDWRLTLIAVSLPSALLAIVLLAIRRGAGSRRTEHAATAVGLEPLWAHLRRRGLNYVLLAVAVNTLMMVQSGLFAWGPTYLMRNFGLARTGAGYLFGAASLAGGVCGTLSSAWVIRRLAPDGTVSQFARLVLMVGPPGVLLIAGATISPSLWLFLPLVLIAFSFIGVLVTIPMQYLQAEAPVHLKGRVAVGLYLILLTFTGGIGPLVPPVLAKLMPPGPDQLGRAIAVSAVICLVISGTLLLVLLRSAARTTAFSKPLTA
ncbi:MFS family permease [Sphingomonas vulcanisoli]|uniref:MFS family permease n=1 Tax=Sphingomonas vulcanisoli TaxID=1658060 RepID=A0ABX0TSI0_9SPHN|nr:MFS transporter [Sphingomonas vulcanisoli]NIJ08484.1 MFS family permease [Sphingomonas vulcanisoli]